MAERHVPDRELGDTLAQLVEKEFGKREAREETGPEEHKGQRSDDPGFTFVKLRRWWQDKLRGTRK